MLGGFLSIWMRWSHTPSITIGLYIDISNFFVKTQVFKELLQKIKDVVSSKIVYSVNNIHIIGPKGAGKSWALVMLQKHFKNSKYIDLSIPSQDIKCETDIILLDNEKKS